MKSTSKSSPCFTLSSKPRTAASRILSEGYKRYKSWYLRRRSRLILRSLSDEQLKDIGLSRSDAIFFDEKK